MSVDVIIGRLSGVRTTGPGKWVALCPAHDDRSPSLAIKDAGGRILLHCFAGCDTETILDCLGLTFGNLFPDHLGDDYQPRRHFFDPLQVLVAIAHEALVVALTAEDLKVTPCLSNDQDERLALAVQRIQSALDAIGERLSRPLELRAIRAAS